MKIKVKDLILKLQEYDENLNIAFACNECMGEYDFDDIKDLKLEKHSDNVDYQLIININ